MARRVRTTQRTAAASDRLYARAARWLARHLTVYRAYDREACDADDLRLVELADDLARDLAGVEAGADRLAIAREAISGAFGSERADDLLDQFESILAQRR